LCTIVSNCLKVFCEHIWIQSFIKDVITKVLLFLLNFCHLIKTLKLICQLCFWSMCLCLCSFKGLSFLLCFANSFGGKLFWLFFSHTVMNMIFSRFFRLGKNLMFFISATMSAVENKKLTSMVFLEVIYVKGEMRLILQIWECKQINKRGYLS